MAEGFLGHFQPASHCFQLFADTPTGPRALARTMHGNLGDVWPDLAALNAQGTGVYFTPNEVIPGAPRRAENVRRVRAFFADSDNPACLAEVEAAIARRGVPPSLAVETSPGKRHFYWLMSDQCPLADFKPMQQAIAAALGTDPSVCDLPRVMRLPGFIHRKGEPFLVRVISP